MEVLDGDYDAVCASLNGARLYAQADLSSPLTASGPQPIFDHINTRLPHGLIAKPRVAALAYRLRRSFDRARFAGLPTVFTFEGGYAVAEVGVNAVNVLQGFDERAG